MSDLTTQGLEPELMQAEQAFMPQDNIFRSFNALNPNIFEDLISNLKTVRQGDLSEYITVANDGRKFQSDFVKQFSSFESMQEFSTSIGLKGSYGVYSASASRKSKTEETSSFTTLYSTYIAEMHLGTISLNGVNEEKMLTMLKPEMVRQLNAITTLAHAHNFVNLWGTHLVTELKTGGMVLVSNSVETGSLEMRETISNKIEASYKKVGSLDLAIDSTNEIKQEWKNILQTVKVRGGDVHMASAFNSNGRSIDKWAESVTTDTTYAVKNSIEIYKLVKGTASEMLKRYMDLTMLAHSLKHPVIFTHGLGAPLNPKPVTVNGRSDIGFKTIGGGAAVTKDSNNFLMGCYPQPTDGSAPTAWIATSHDLMSPTAAGDTLTGYAIAIHDPANYLDIMVAKGTGSNTGMGEDHAEATLPAGWIMTCGGAFSETIKGSNKFITSSHYKDAQTWAAASSDYKEAATNVVLNAYAVGIKSKDPLLHIEANYQAGAIVRGQHGSPTAIGRGFVCGGGMNVTDNSGPGNLVQMNYPSASDIWHVHNKDHDGSASQARSQAFAISLQANIQL